jgi:hypothetical protein
MNIINRSGIHVWIVTSAQQSSTLEAVDTALSYLISVGLIAFGVWIGAAKAASGSLLVWTFVGLIPVVVAQPLSRDPERQIAQ